MSLSRPGAVARRRPGPRPEGDRYIAFGPPETEVRPCAGCRPPDPERGCQGEDGWQTDALRIGRALGREGQARTLADETEALIARTAAEHPGLLDADVLLMLHGSPALQKSVEDSRIFQGLEAVARDAYVTVDLDTAVALRTPTVLSIPSALGEVAPPLAAALAGR